MILIILTAVVVAVIGLSAGWYIMGSSAREHTVIIPSGAFIPPKDWKPGKLVFSQRYFNPSNITINVGDRVRWVNLDSVTHTVTDTNERKLFDKILNPKEQYAVTFNKQGQYIYMCTIHPWQGGFVEVIKRGD